MAKFTSVKYPGLLVGGLRLRFVDGAIETDRPEEIKRLEALVADGRFGVERVGEADEGEKPTKVPTKAELVAEAEALGVTVPAGANKATVAELIAAAKAAPVSDGDEPEGAGRDW